MPIILTIVDTNTELDEIYGTICWWDASNQQFLSLHLSADMNYLHKKEFYHSNEASTEMNDLRNTNYTLRKLRTKQWNIKQSAASTWSTHQCKKLYHIAHTCCRLRQFRLCVGCCCINKNDEPEPNRVFVMCAFLMRQHQSVFSSFSFLSRRWCWEMRRWINFVAYIQIMNVPNAVWRLRTQHKHQLQLKV